MRYLALILAVAIPAVASAQSDYDPMRSPVTPRDVRWYMGHPTVMSQTLRVCGSNAAYADTPDCQNANSASAGIMGQVYAQANQRSMASNPALDIQNPAYWSANPIAREGILTQCRRRGPGDDLVAPYCGAAARSKLNSLNSR